MKLKLLLYFLPFVFFNCFAQKQKTFTGKIVFNETGLEKIDVVNLKAKKSCTTNSEGNFSIEAKVGDVLFVLSKEYYDIKITLTQNDFLKDHLLISLSKKPIELDEVTIKNVEKFRVNVTPDEIVMAKLSRYESSPKVVGVYTGEMPYGTDFIGIF